MQGNRHIANRLSHLRKIAVSLQVLGRILDAGIEGLPLLHLHLCPLCLSRPLTARSKQGGKVIGIFSFLDAL